MKKDIEGFRDWLEQNMVDYSPRVIIDTVSRFRRVLKMIELSSTYSEKNMMYLLTSSPEFIALNSTVKCQLKRTVSLYIDYLKKD